MNSCIFPVILAGGSGTRLWPLSRKNYPKQFLALNGKDSLLQQTAKRALALSAAPLIVSNDAHYFLCQEQMLDIACQATYILEPCARNTAPAIACAAQYIKRHYGAEALLLILPSDHWIDDESSWLKTIQKAAAYASQERTILTFGIKPDSPKTGYGYIEANLNQDSDVHPVRSFREKPDLETARHFLEQGNYFWNSGMFLCQAQVFLDEIQRYSPDIAHYSTQALDQASIHHDFIRLEASAFGLCPEDSIDYAVMEKSELTTMIPLTLGWSDLGDWSAVAETRQQDEQGNSLSGNVVVKNTHNCLINSDQMLVSALGISNQIIVATKDAVLVADKEYTQQVKDLVNALAFERPQLTQDHHKVMRPWGYFEILAEGSAFKVKRLMVKPKGQLSLQKHQFRSEHWVVVAGQADIINGDEHFVLSVNESTYIPPNTLHRLSNSSDQPLYIIEVQTGSYLGEDDIQRFDDIYQRERFTELT